MATSTQPASGPTLLPVGAAEVFPAVAVKTPEEETPLLLARSGAAQGHLPQAVVQSVVQRGLGELRACSGISPHGGSELSGKVVVQFEISASGSVSSAQLTSSTLPDAAVNLCIVDAYQRLEFPAPEGGAMLVQHRLRFSTI